MAILRVRVTPEDYRRLAELAVKERRPVPWQAEAMLSDALKASAQQPHGDKGAGSEVKGRQKGE